MEGNDFYFRQDVPWHAPLAWKQSLDLDYVWTVAVVCFDQIADYFTL